MSQDPITQALNKSVGGCIALIVAIAAVVFWVVWVSFK